jgi:MoxR-like ATPase
VILIDEIDKAPRDFPNDLLDAIQHLRFGIRELDREAQDRLAEACGGAAQITADETLRPIVIITSNSEKNLPAPFLRRCVYFNIPAPGPGRLRLIVSRRVGGLTTLDDAALRKADEIAPEQSLPLMRSAVAFFEKIRAVELSKPPSAAELIEWLRYLKSSGVSVTQELKDVPGKVRDSLGVLVKSIDDYESVEKLASDAALGQLLKP